jgi:hypothetical protein
MAVSEFQAQSKWHGLPGRTIGGEFELYTYPQFLAFPESNFAEHIFHNRPSLVPYTRMAPKYICRVNSSLNC